MQKRVFLILILSALLLLWGCSAQNSSEELMQPTETASVPVTEPETIPETEPETIPEREPETQPPTEPEILAQEVTEGLTIFFDGVRFNSILHDDSYYTKYKIYPENLLSMEFEQPVSGLYLLWDEAPGEYQISWEGGSISCGQEGFLHEYVFLPEPVTRVEFTFHGEECVLLCDVKAYTEGTPPADVQVWQPPCEQADILVFPTHSDDDALFFGALISYYAIERELTVQTAFMVDHRGYEERNHERLNGLWEMGVRNYPIVGTARDSATLSRWEAMSIYKPYDIGGWQVELIRRFQPLVVVGHDLEGEYGNGGHKVNAYYLTQAITMAADPEQYPDSAAEYGVWETPKMYLHLYPENRIILDVNTPLQNDPQGRTPFEIAEDAYAHHVSQHKYYFSVTQDEEDTKHDCRPFGLYYTLVGYDTTADIMENIDPEQWREE